MGLKLILGSSGSGKTYTLYRDCVKNENRNHRYFVVVPEQYTLETQKTIVEMSENKGTMNVDIVSFNRLAVRVFEETGMYMNELLDDSGKCMVLRKVMEEKKDVLKIFGSKIAYPGFVDEVKSLISEFYQYGIGEKQIENIIETSGHHHLLKGKMEDISIILKAFQEFMKERYMVPEELMERLCEEIHKSDMIKNSTITFDGFTGFTTMQYRVIEQLIRCSGEVIVTVTIPEHVENEDVFSLSLTTISRLKRLAEDAGTGIEVNVLPDEKNYRLKSSGALRYIEKNLFSYNGKKFVEETEEISIFEAPDIVKECDFVCKEINRLVRENGYRYKDIAVVTGDIERYSHSLEQAFRYYEIPAFIDSNRQMNHNPFIEAIKSLIDVVDNNYDYESMFRYLRCGMADMDIEDIDRIENYVIQYGISSYKRWNMEWKNADDDLNSGKEHILLKLNPLYHDLKKKNITVRELTGILYDFIESEEMQKKLWLYEKQFAEEGNLSLSKEYSQIYGKVMILFDKVVSLLGDEKMKLKDYKGILESGFAEIKVGMIPPTIDRVVVGDMERTRLGNIKTMFFMGVNDGIVPKNTGGGGILSETDRRFLEESKIELSPTRRQNAFIQKFYLYLNITKMSEKLFITYSQTNTEGNSIRPSYLIQLLCNKIECLKIQSTEKTYSLTDNISTKKTVERVAASGLRDYIAGIKDIDDEWKEIYSVLVKTGDYNKIADAAFYRANVTNLEKAVSNAIYGENIRGSVSRLETYASCAYRHFILYGLNLVKRRRFEITPADVGNIYHNSLEIFSRKLRDKNLKWGEISDESRKIFVRDAMEVVSAYYEGTAIHGSARNEYQLKRIYDVLDRTTWALCNQIRAGEFEPEGYEVEFDSLKTSETMKFDLEDGGVMSLKGIIDRMDMYETDENIYIKIIDYKSGNKQFDILDVYNGLQLQLVLYMEAALDMAGKNIRGKKVIPAGIFYYDINNPVADSEVGEDIEKELLINMRPNGVVNQSDEVIRAMDKMHQEGETGSSLVIPVSYKKDGVRASGNIISERDFDMLIRFVHEKTKRLGSDMHKGIIDKNPYRMNDSSKKNPCEYCDFKSICRFDTGIAGNEFRNINKIKPEEVWQKIRKAGEGCANMD